MFKIAYIRALTTAATKLGAQLPADVTDRLNHVATIGAQVRAAGTTEAQVVTDLGKHLGNPTALAKALPAALDAIVRSNAASSVAAHLEQQATSAAWMFTKRNSEAVAAAFGTAVAPHLATLNKHAAGIPVWTDEATAGDLTPVQFEAWTVCRAAAAAVDVALLALAPLYAAGADDQLTLEAARRLTICDIPATVDYDSAWAWLNAASGRRGVGTLVGGMKINHDGAWFAQVAALGGRFEWAGVADTGQRIQRLRAASVTPLVLAG